MKEGRISCRFSGALYTGESVAISASQFVHHTLEGVINTVHDGQQFPRLSGPALTLAPAFPISLLSLLAPAATPAHRSIVLTVMHSCSLSI